MCCYKITMEQDTITMITVIANLFLTPILQYLIASRCSKIRCCCIECDRDVVDVVNNNK